MADNVFQLKWYYSTGVWLPRRPRTVALRALAQSAFVDKDDGATLVFGLFFNSGQRFRFHC